MMKTDGGVEFPAEAYAYVGDPGKVDTWKIRLWETPEAKVTVAQLGRAAAAFSPGGFRGEPVDLPEEAVARVKGRIRAEYGKLGVKPADIPKSVAASEGPQFVIVLNSAEAGAGLARIPLAKIGSWWKGKLHFRITRDDLKQIVASFHRKANDLIVDYEHGTVYAEPGTPVPAAGWLKSIDEEPDKSGVLWGSVEWTEKARQMIAAKEYKYVSPTFAWGTRDKKTGAQLGAAITSVALTGTPVLEEMPALALSEAGWTEEEPAAPARREKRIMKLILSDRATGKVRVVQDDGTEQTVALEGLETPAKVIALSEVGRTKDGRLDFAALAELPAGTVIAPEVIRAINADGELQAAVACGKITPAQRKHFERMAIEDPGGFKELVASMKPQVVVDKEKGFAGGTEGLTLDQIDERVIALADEKIAADKGLSFERATELVLSEHPDLRMRLRELRR